MRKFGHSVKLDAQKPSQESLLKVMANRVLLSLGMLDKVETKAEMKLVENKGVILCSTEKLEQGSVVFMESESGRSALPDGTYTLENGMTITVKESVVEIVSGKAADNGTETDETELATAPVNEAVLMSAINKVIELSSAKEKANEELLKNKIAAALSKMPLTVPMQAKDNPTKTEMVTLSKHEVALMSVQERAYHIAMNAVAVHGSPKEANVKLASGQPTITSTYAGEFALPYISAAVLGGPTLGNNLVTIKENVGPKGVTVKTLAVANIIQAAGCDFLHQGTVALDERKLIPVDLKTNIEICKTPYLSDWEAMSMGRGRMGKQLPPNFSSYFLTEIAAIIAGSFETRVWQGVAGAGAFDGFDVILDDGSDIAITGGAVTPANVITKLRLAIAEVPQALKFNPNLRVYVAGDIALAYVQQLGDQGFMNEYQAGVKPLNIDGYQMVYCPGKTAGSITICTPDQLWFGTDLVSDMSSAKVLDMEDVDGSDNVRIVMKYTGGCQIAVRGDIVHGLQAA
jgi:hypothetical protein